MKEDLPNKKVVASSNEFVPLRLASSSVVVEWYIAGFIHCDHTGEVGLQYSAMKCS